MAEKKKEVVISTENVNCYGARVLTDGIDISQYERNPVLLYMHQRFGRDDMPIGRMENLRKEDGKLIGTPVFDLNDPYAKKIADKWENDFLRMVSPSLDIVETSDAPEMILVGQYRPTVTKSKMSEISIVDIGGNDNALPLQFRHGGQVLELSDGKPCTALPLLELKNTTPEGDDNNKLFNLKKQQMKQILLALGLTESATSEQAVEAIATMKAKADTAEQVRLSAITSAVDSAISAKRITADQKNHFVNLGKTAGLEALNTTLELMRPAQKPSDVIDSGKESASGKTELSWKDLTPDTAEKLKADKPDEYVKLYRAEFGCNPF